MKWYTAECLFRSTLQGGPARSTQLLERRYFLIKAANGHSATKRAREFAKKKQHSYLNDVGIRVDWILEKVIDVQEILGKRLMEGTEVFHEYSNRRVGKGRK
jgi:hypothetical protein